MNIFMVMLAFFASIIFITCAFSVCVPRGVIIDGIEVGGLTYAQATNTVRRKILEEVRTKRLTVHGQNSEYVFAYPEIAFKDNLSEILKSAKKDGKYKTKVSYYLNGANEIAAYICNGESVPLVEPYYVFNNRGQAFTYFEGNDGVSVDRRKLASDMAQSLNGGFNDVYLNFKTSKRRRTLEQVKYDTRLLSAFTTYFDSSNTDRSHNIALAASKINATVLYKNQQFSFNASVGARTEERGFKAAKIISGGEFVEGIGGGVCQVSTTLFNAALLAGCAVTEFHPHSLAVSYVPPSRDAMVSGSYFDLKFKNTTDYPLYIRARMSDNSVTFSIYGRGDGATYGFSTKVIESIDAPEEKTDDPALEKRGKNGVISEGYLTVTRGGIKKTVLYRRDRYAPIKRVVFDDTLR